MMMELLDLGLTDLHLAGMSSTLVCYVKRDDVVVVHLAGALNGELVFERVGWEDGIVHKALLSVSPTLDEVAGDLIGAIEAWQEGLAGAAA